MSFNIGLEIGEKYLKMAAVRSQGKQSKLFDCIAEDISSLTDEQITAKIIDIFRKRKLKPSLLILCLSRNLVTIRNLHLPSQNPQEIVQMIDLNLPRIVPYKKEEIVSGYQTLGTDDMGYTKIILAIVHSSPIRRQLRITEGAGLFIDKICLSSYGVWQWVCNNHYAQINSTDIYLLLDIDATFSDFIIFLHNKLLFTRSINIGAHDFGAEGQVGITKLLGEVKQSLVIFYNEEINKKPARVFLSGATVAADLIKMIEADLDVPVTTVALPYTQKISDTSKRDVFRDVSLTGVSDLILEDSKETLCFALPEIQIRKSLKEKTRDLVILGSFSIYIFTIICAIFLGRSYNQQIYLYRLERHSAVIEKEMGDLVGQVGRIEFVKDYLTGRKLPLFIISQLQKTIPEEIAINFIDLDDQGRVTLRGQALDLSEVFKFTATLEKSKNFKDVQIKSTRKKMIKDKELTDFELAFQIGFEQPPVKDKLSKVK